MKAAFKVKLEMAKFLQETLDEMAPQAKGRSSQTAKEFSEFIVKVSLFSFISFVSLFQVIIF